MARDFVPTAVASVLLARLNGPTATASVAEAAEKLPAASELSPMASASLPSAVARSWFAMAPPPTAVDLKPLALEAVPTATLRLPPARAPLAVMPSIEGTSVQFVDATGRRVDVARTFRHGWLFDALAGDGALSVFGLWDGHVFDPVSVEHEGRLFSLAHVGEQPVLSRVA